MVTITPDAAATITHVAEGEVANAFSYTVEHSNQYANQKKEEGKLKVTPATLTIVTEGAEKEYDGTPLTAPGTVTGYKNNEKADFTVTGTITEVGEVDNSYTIVFAGEEGASEEATAVRSDYKIEETVGTLKITKSSKALVITSSTKSWTYDGNAHTDEVYTVTYDGAAVVAGVIVTLSPLARVATAVLAPSATLTV